jgi:hypothetical protein
MTSKPVKKSALDWIRANLPSLPPSPFALQAEPAAADPASPEEMVSPQAPPSSESAAAKPGPLPATVEVWLELVSRPDQPTHAWAALARSGDRRGIIIALNAAHRLVAKARQRRDEETLAFLVALPLAETLIRRRREPFVAATLERISATSLPEEKRKISDWLFLSELLVAGPQLKAAAAELAGGVLAEPRLIFDVRLEAYREPKG